ncbi:hypothetical protein ACHM2U_01750 [Clostridium perfringens]|uniref:hypothetical protein n=1 Tax=Clostridium perfringens TaxID=1502 RepID=UPI0037540B67
MRRYKMVIISIIILLLINNIMHSKVSYALDIANSKNQVLLSEIPNEEIYLYALDSDEGKSVYEDILLNVKGKKKRFNWIVDSGLSFRPELILTDINNDGKKRISYNNNHRTWHRNKYSRSTYIQGRDFGRN